VVNDGLGERTVTLLRDRDLRQRLASGARKLVEEKYDWEVVTHALEAAMLESSRLKARNVC
jgi:glycosyltransferase involved in cell wall biosynthesis